MKSSDHTISAPRRQSWKLSPSACKCIGISLALFMTLLVMTPSRAPCRRKLPQNKTQDHVSKNGAPLSPIAENSEAPLYPGSTTSSDNASPPESDNGKSDKSDLASEEDPLAKA